MSGVPWAFGTGALLAPRCRGLCKTGDRALLILAQDPYELRLVRGGAARTGGWLSKSGGRRMPGRGTLTDYVHNACDRPDVYA
ncbi:hypothetical protein ABIA33_006440 [Streptacidiphilus sp. MAP12-16]